MTLICTELDEMVWAHSKAFAVRHPLGPGFAVSEAAINQIPAQERRKSPCELMENGLNVHAGHGTTMAGTWQFSTFKVGDFLFSITEESAILYLPRTLTRITEKVLRNMN